jgi:hypothetical protein
MLRPFAFAAILALAVPTLALAQHDEHHPPGKPVGKPVVVPRGAVVAPRGAVVVPRGGGARVGGPIRVGGPAGPFVYHGHPYAWHPVHFARPWAYPPGFGYRLWAVGAILPPLFWSTPTYYYTGWADMGLPPPDPGFQYVQYGPDLLLVNVATGEVVQAFPAAFN